MGIARALKRGQVKIYRKIFGKGKREIAISKPSGAGLTSLEIKEVLSALGTALRKQEIPKISYEYRPPVRFLAREILYVLPKDKESVGSVALKVRVVLRKAFGKRYKAQAI